MYLTAILAYIDKKGLRVINYDFLNDLFCHRRISSYSGRKKTPGNIIKTILDWTKGRSSYMV
jgi:hypothetical protein